MFWKLWNVFYKNTFLNIFMVLKILWNILTLIFHDCVYLLLATMCLYLTLHLRSNWKTMSKRPFIKSGKEATTSPLLMRYWAKITGKLYLFFHSFVFIWCPIDSKLTIFTAHLLCMYEYTEHCFIPSSIPYAWCNYSI